jgi:hypothetical protein
MAPGQRTHPVGGYESVPSGSPELVPAVGAEAIVGGGEYAGGMRWSEFAAREQVLAAVAHDQLVKPGVVLAGTTRRDGSARISGVEPLIMDGELWLSMMPSSVKARDLYRDPRILLHTASWPVPPRRPRS